MSPTVAAHNLVFLSCMLLDKFLEKTVKIVDTRDETQYKWKELRFPCNDRTDEVNKLFIIWPF